MKITTDGQKTALSGREEAGGSTSVLTVLRANTTPSGLTGIAGINCQGVADFGQRG